VSTGNPDLVDPRPTVAAGTRESTAGEVAKMLTRVMLGWFLLHQGWGKVMQDWTGGLGSYYRGDQYQGAIPEWLPTLVAVPYGYALPWLELVVGTLLLLGLFNRVSAGVATVLFASILVAWLDAGRLLPRHMLMIYAPLGAWFFFSGPGLYSLDGWIARRRGRASGL
jgi:uncharacterized membrane protein YphA (DoxX/SURF4 family)